MRKSVATAGSLAWFVVIGGTFGCVLPWVLGYWHFHQPVSHWWIARVVGIAAICGGLVPLVDSFVQFFRAGGTPIPVASPPRLVVTGFYRYVRNPIYVGFLFVLVGQTLLFGSRGLLEYTVAAWCVGAAAVRWYEQPILARKFGAQYQAYRRAVPAWRPRLTPWNPDGPSGPEGTS
jgi:protein-S-isoprenylcysteine O-methyltransferase Ste14